MNDFMSRMNNLKKSLDVVSSMFGSAHFLKDSHFEDCKANTFEEENMVCDNRIKNMLTGMTIKKTDMFQPDKKPSPIDLKIGGKLFRDQVTTPEEGSTTVLLSPEDSNAKTIKNKTQGKYDTKIMYLSPASAAGVGNVCPSATAGCISSCLDTAGMGGMVGEENPINGVHEARVKRTRHVVNHPHHSLAQLHKEISNHKKNSLSNGDTPVIRLNGTSDLAWEEYSHPDWEGKNIFDMHPEVQFYDYTKRANRVRENKHSNYHLTYSLAETEKNQTEARKLLNEGHNVAVPFGFPHNKFTDEGKETIGVGALPKKHWDCDVVDGDEHDLRFLDDRSEAGQKGKIVGLRAKGEGVYDTSGFVQWGHEGAPNATPRAAVEGRIAPRQRVNAAQKEIDAGTREQPSVVIARKKADNKILREKGELGPSKRSKKKSKEAKKEDPTDEGEKLAASEIGSLFKSLIYKINKSIK